MKRWTKWLLLALLAGVGVSIWQAVRRPDTHQPVPADRLARVQAELDAADPGWRLEQLLAAREAACPPDNENLILLARDVDARTPREYTDWLGASDGWLHPTRVNHLPSVADADAARRTRDLCREVIEAARKGRPGNRGGTRLQVPPNPLDVRLDHNQPVRLTISLLELDAHVSAIDGDPDRAVAGILAACHTGRALGDEPTLITQLVRIACTAIARATAERVLAWGQPRAGLAELQAIFLAEAGEPLLTVGFRGERAMMNRLFENIESGRVTDTTGIYRAGTGAPEARLRAVGLAAYREHLPEDYEYMMGVYARLIAISRTPEHEQRALFAAVPLPPEDDRHLISRILLPAWDRIAEAHLRSKAHLRSAAAGVACERFRRAHGRWPKDLAELPKELLPAVPADPYTGEPIRFRRTENGVVIYSVGPDGQDDEGNLSPRSDPGTDHGFRLWDVPARRAAPLPKPKPQADDEP